MLPGLAFPVSRVMMLIAADGDYEVSVNGIKLDNPRKAPSGSIFLMFMDQNTLSREPEAEHCRIFTISQEVLKPGENVIVILNAGVASISIQRLDLGFW